MNKLKEKGYSKSELLQHSHDDFQEITGRKYKARR